MSLKTKNGLNVPSIGLGTYKLQDNNVLKEALHSGYRLLDCAQVYHNQHLIGPQLKSVSRDELFVVSKVWPNSLSRGLPKISLNKSLAELQLSELDLLLIHWPIVFKESKDDFPLDENQRILLSEETQLEDVWREFLSLRDQKLTRYVGVSNFNQEQLTSLYDKSGVWPQVNQIESHLLFQNQSLIDFCIAKGIVVMAYCPLSRGKALTLDSVKRIASKHSVSESRVCLRFSTQRNLIVIPKSNSIERLRDNLKCNSFDLTEDEMKELFKEERAQRISTFDKYKINECKNYPF